jgi:hypothetical protein
MLVGQATLPCPCGRELDHWLLNAAERSKRLPEEQQPTSMTLITHAFMILFFIWYMAWLFIHA